VARASEAQRLARRAWKLLHVDSAHAIALADQALAKAQERADTPGEAWARLARGFHLLYFARPRVAAPELRAAQKLFDAQGDRAGHILARTGLARGLWREGRYDAALELVLSLRDEGLAVLRHEQRGLLLNTIAGCYSARNHSEQAFAYMYQALRDAPPARGHGYDAVLHCNLAHELLQLGDYHEALKHVEAGLARFDAAKNPRLASVLWINRVIALSELDRQRAPRATWHAPVTHSRPYAAAPRPATRASACACAAPCSRCVRRCWRRCATRPARWPRCATGSA